MLFCSTELRACVVDANLEASMPCSMDKASFSVMRGSIRLAKGQQVFGLWSTDAHSLLKSMLLAAMNPATDAGKRALPTLLRSRFTELWVSEPSAREDLEMLVASCLMNSGCQQPVSSIVNFYLAAKADAVRVLLPASCAPCRSVPAPMPNSHTSER